MMKHVLFVCIVLASLVGEVMAQEVSLSGEYRINPVYSRGFRDPLYKGDEAGVFTMQRTRLILNYSMKDDLDAEFIIQDRRFWGDQNDRADVANMAVFRAWAEKHFTPNFSVRLGRQGFVYDLQYILSDPNWVGTRAHDAALVKYENESFKAHLALAYNANGQELKAQPYEYNMYKNMQFVWLEKKFNNVTASFIVLNRGMAMNDTTTDVAYTQTFGPYINAKISDKLSFRGLYYHQVGKTKSDLDVNAYFYSAQLVYAMSKSLEFNIGVDAASGTSQTNLENPNNTKSNSFDKMYGLHHGHFGYIDYFYVNNPTLCGIEDYYVKAKLKVTNKFSIDNHLHNFMSAATINSSVDGKTMNRELGIENDLLLNYKFSSTFKATLGHSIMFGTSTLDEFFGGKKSVENQYFYAVITATPNFFKSKSE